MPAIETVYRCRIDYKWEGEGVDGAEAVEKRSFRFACKERHVEWQSFAGCPACFPYIEIEGPNRQAIERLAGKIERYINRRKDVRLLED